MSLEGPEAGLYLVLGRCREQVLAQETIILWPQHVKVQVATGLGANVCFSLQRQVAFITVPPSDEGRDRGPERGNGKELHGGEQA